MTNLRILKKVFTYELDDIDNLLSDEGLKARRRAEILAWTMTKLLKILAEREALEEEEAKRQDVLRLEDFDNLLSDEGLEDKRRAEILMWAMTNTLKILTEKEALEEKEQEIKEPIFDDEAKNERNQD